MVVSGASTNANTVFRKKCSSLGPQELIFSFFKNSQNSNNNSQTKKDDALEILKKRFANSEINEEEYHSKREILKG